ncbi:hypothetical protein [Corynebacterium cystitidis]|uniref:hypothetical protein n=1 Tax=Corynebacterium cystitidis TaxID=35757 RepID=UPI00211ED6BB|nr:hypothetical protein [Corynebacterium cystitidis]
MKVQSLRWLRIGVLALTLFAVVALMLANSVAHASSLGSSTPPPNATVETDTSAPSRPSACGDATESATPVRLSKDQTNEAKSIAQEHMSEIDATTILDWEKANVAVASEGKVWVTAAPVSDPKETPQNFEFYRIAVDLELSEVVNVQTYRIGQFDPATGQYESWMLSDGDLLWHGHVDKEGNTTTAPDSPMDPAFQTQGACEWGVGALCGTGGAATCYGVCLGLGFVNGLAGLGCASVCGLIGALGCTGATNAICK